MRTKLKMDLNDDRITDICSDIFYYIKPECSKSDLYIEYRILQESEKNFAGNKNMTRSYMIQVDIFSKGSYKELSDTILNVLKEKGYGYTNGVELYEEDTHLYHKALRFKYSKFVK